MGGALAFAMGVVALAAGAPSPGANAVEVNLEVVGRSDLGDTGLDGDIAVVGTTAVIGTGRAAGLPADAGRYDPAPCVDASVKVVDVKDPRKPGLVAALPEPAGLAVADLDALAVATPSFTGDLVAVALHGAVNCSASAAGGGGAASSAAGGGAAASSAAGGIAYYDVTVPGAPRFLGRDPDERPRRSVSLVQREDGRVLSISVDDGGLRVVDVTDPVNPAIAGTWAPSAREAVAGHRCDRSTALRSVRFRPGGDWALVASLDAGVYQVDLTNPAAPIESGRFRYGAEGDGQGGAAFAFALDLDERTLVLVSEDGWCDEPGGWGAMRVLEVDPGQQFKEVRALRGPRAAAYPPPDRGQYGPGRAVGSGQQAFVAWHAEGLRVIDFGESPVKAIAQFIPPDVPDPTGTVPAKADVVGVALLTDHVLVTDTNSGLYVLDRPDEGKAGSIWSEVKLAAAALGAAMMLLLIAVPQLLLGASFAGGFARRRVPVRTRRR